MIFNYIYYLFIITSLTMYTALSDTECKNTQSHSDRRINKNQFRLVQYNMEWVFVDYYKNADCPGNGCTWKNESDINTHISYLTDTINKLEPDIMNICEIEGCDELNRLISNTSSSYNPYLIKGTDTSTGQNVGMLTKIDPDINLYRSDLHANYPIPNSKCNYTGSSGSSGVSKHYITEFTIQDTKVAMIAAHLLSMPTDPYRCTKREAQATVLQNIIKDYINKNYEIIFLGDLNDYDKDILDVNNNIPTSQVLDILKGTYSDDYTLYSVSENIPQSERYSNWWDSENNCKDLPQNYALIDHILTTSNLKNKIQNAFIYHGYKEYCGKWNSDHYPVVVDFVL